MVFTLILSYVRKKKKPGLYLQQVDNFLAIIPQRLHQQIDKKYPLVK